MSSSSSSSSSVLTDVDCAMLDRMIDNGITMASKILDDVGDSTSVDIDTSTIVTPDDVNVYQRMLWLLIQTGNPGVMQMFESMQRRNIDIGDKSLKLMIKQCLCDDEIENVAKILAYCEKKFPRNTIRSRLGLTDAEWIRIAPMCTQFSSSPPPPPQYDKDLSSEIVRLSRDDDVAGAVALFNTIVNTDIVCSADACNTLIVKMRSSYPIKEIDAVYQYMKRMKIKRDIYTYNGMLSAYKFGKNNTGIEMIVADMAREKVRYDSCTCTILAPWYEYRKKWHMVVALFNEHTEAIKSNIVARRKFGSIFASRNCAEYNQCATILSANM